MRYHTADPWVIPQHDTLRCLGLGRTGAHSRTLHRPCGRLRIAVQALANGARVMDAGVKVPGRLRCGPRAGRAVHGRPRPRRVHVAHDRWRLVAGRRLCGPTIRPKSCMASQYAGWAINPEGFFAMGSARCARRPASKRSCLQSWATRRTATRGVLVLEGRALPTEHGGRHGWPPRRVVARGADLRRGAHREPRRRRADCRARPRNRASQDGNARLRRHARRQRDGNGAVADAGAKRHAGDRPHQRLHSLRRSGAICGARRRRRTGRARRRACPASASADYGTPFYDIFKRYDNDFYKIDPMLFSPAEVWLTSATSGRTFHAGRLDPRCCGASLFD